MPASTEEGRGPRRLRPLAVPFSLHLFPTRAPGLPGKWVRPSTCDFLLLTTGSTGKWASVPCAQRCPPYAQGSLLEGPLRSSGQWEGILAFSFRRGHWARAHPRLVGKRERAGCQVHAKTQISPMMVTKLAGSHFSLGLGRLFCLLPTSWGLRVRAQPVHLPQRCAHPTPPHPLPTLPVAQLEAALVPTDGSCGSPRHRAQSPADIFLPAPLVGEG